MHSGGWQPCRGTGGRLGLESVAGFPWNRWQACYEPELNRTYEEMGRHYGVAIIPTRSAKPRDKAKVESGVLVVERWILARLRDRQFFSLVELNTAIAELLEVLNNRPFKKLPGTRKSLFDSLDRPAMQPLPATPYEYAEWKKVRVNIDYHVAIDKHYYSVPYQLVKQQLEARITRGRELKICSTSFAVAGPVSAAQRTNRSGVHSAYSRCAFGMCTFTVVCRPCLYERR